jgi:hypothetical protein
MTSIKHNRDNIEAGKVMAEDSLEDNTAFGETKLDGNGRVTELRGPRGTLHRNHSIPFLTGGQVSSNKLLSRCRPSRRLRYPRVHFTSVISVLVAAVGALSHLLTPATSRTALDSIRAHHMVPAVYVAGVFVINLIAWGSHWMRDQHIAATLWLAFGNEVIGAMAWSTATQMLFGARFAAGI